jgi:hypothetical protein
MSLLSECFVLFAGEDILSAEQSSLPALLERLEPREGLDSKFYRIFFGKRESWSNEVLHKQLENMRGSNSVLKADLGQEKHFKFIFSHVRSGRYHPVELGVILEHMIKDVKAKEEKETWLEVASKLKEVSAREETHPDVKKVQDFILHCANSLHRGRQTWEGAIKRNCAAGVILFGDFKATPLDPKLIEPSRLEIQCGGSKELPIKLMWQLVRIPVFPVP